MDNHNEKWKSIVGYEGLYEVSDKGRVRSVDRELTYRTGKVVTYRGRLKALSRGGWHRRYLTVHLTREGEHKRFLVHRLVAGAFIPNPSEKPFINHVDGNPQNNVASNLEWCTHQENMDHAVHVGLTNKGEKHWNARLDEGMVKNIKQAHASGRVTQRAIAKRFGVSYQHVSDILLGKRWA